MRIVSVAALSIVLLLITPASSAVEPNQTVSQDPCPDLSHLTRIERAAVAVPVYCQSIDTPDPVGQSTPGPDASMMSLLSCNAPNVFALPCFLQLIVEKQEQ
jgi:hypothetical protein